MVTATQIHHHSFDHLSHFEISRSIDKVFQNERHCQADFILLLAEIQSRRLHIELGYTSLMVYCTKHFGLSEFSARKRMQIARNAKRYPELIRALRAKFLSLTTAAMIAPKLKETTGAKQISQCLGKSKDEVARIIVGWEPKPDVSESIRHMKTPT